MIVLQRRDQFADIVIEGGYHGRVYATVRIGDGGEPVYIFAGRLQGIDDIGAGLFCIAKGKGISFAGAVRIRFAIMRGVVSEIEEKGRGCRPAVADEFERMLRNQVGAVSFFLLQPIVDVPI